MIIVPKVKEGDIRLVMKNRDIVIIDQEGIEDTHREKVNVTVVAMTTIPPRGCTKLFLIKDLIIGVIIIINLCRCGHHHSHRPRSKERHHHRHSNHHHRSRSESDESEFRRRLPRESSGYESQVSHNNKLIN